VVSDNASIEGKSSAGIQILNHPGIGHMCLFGEMRNCIAAIHRRLLVAGTRTR
jgi:hypothetical protein